MSMRLLQILPITARASNCCHQQPAKSPA
jgi:hypothetical protein